MKRIRGAGHHTLRTAIYLIVTVCVAAGLSAVAVAQDGPIQPDPVRVDPEQQRQREQTMAELRLGIDNMQGLDAGERTRMHERLRACYEAGMPPEQLVGLFPAPEQRHLQARTAIRVQNRVVAALHDGLPVGPVAAKVREGCVKGVPEERIEQAAQRVEANLRIARRVMAQSVADGLTPPTDPQQQANQVCTMAQHMWSGLQEGDLNRLRERARERLRTGDCRTQDLVGAGGAAARMMEAGVKRDEAVRLSGDALQRGYSGPQMQEMSALVATGSANGGPLDRMLRDLEECVAGGVDCEEMARHMFRNGWLGPRQMDGVGSHDGGVQHGAGSPGYQGGSAGGHQQGGENNGGSGHGGSGGGG